MSARTVARIARATLACTPSAFRGDVPLEMGSRWVKWFGHETIRDAEIDLSVSGAENLDPSAPYVYMANHSSHIDVPVVYASCPSKHVRFVGKKELFKVPLWGRAMEAGGMVKIDRSNREQAIQSLRDAEELFDAGVCIWVFPEGTRTKTGELGPLKKGGFHLAKNAGVPIVPVVITGTRNILASGSLVMHKGQQVSVRYGAPIDTKTRSVKELHDMVGAYLRDNVGD